MKILIADDNNTDRLILKKILSRNEHEVFAAADGLEAVELFKQCDPEIVLLDALMPHMDGYDAAVEIKKHPAEKLVPIIFLTSLQDASALAKCLEVGGDDFLTKPYNPIILEAKLKAFERMMLLYDEVRAQKNKISVFNAHMVQEQEVAKRVFDNIAHSGNLEQANIKYLLSPMSVFNGDLLLSARAPSGSSHIMLGDFTGHGLPAAIGAMPVAEIFYGMTLKGFSIADIITEINRRLSSILPVGVFCCATACEINYRDQSMTVWAGGLPDAYLVRPAEGIIKTITSKHLPLGVLKAESFQVATEVYRFQDEDKLYLFSDGILEAESPDEEMFGEQRVISLIEKNADKAEFLTALLTALRKFTQTENQSDDHTLIEYTFDALADGEAETEHSISNTTIRPLDWLLVYEFRPQTLKTFDPLPLVLQILLECPGLKPYRGRVFTILAELYSNALDHGVLGLDSTMKQSAEGFVEYYQQRQQRLDELEAGYVRIQLEHLPNDKGGDLIIQVKDSGDGFDVSSKSKADNSFSGRGLKLIGSLCSSVDYSDDGRCVRVVFQWQYR